MLVGKKGVNCNGFPWFAHLLCIHNCSNIKIHDLPISPSILTTAIWRLTSRACPSNARPEKDAYAHGKACGGCSEPHLERCRPCGVGTKRGGTSGLGSECCRSPAVHTGFNDNRRTPLCGDCTTDNTIRQGALRRCAGRKGWCGFDDGGGRGDSGPPAKMLNTVATNAVSATAIRSGCAPAARLRPPPAPACAIACTAAGANTTTDPTTTTTTTI